jgi:hypothetical protein
MELFKHSLYINLKHRTDRNERVQEELSKMNIVCERVEAIRHEKGNIGCTYSHIKCLTIAKERKYPYVFICEDDIQFTNTELLKKNMEKFENMHNSGFKWDVLIIGGNTCPPFEQINDFCVRTYNVQTTTGYIVQQHYYDILLDNYKDGVYNLLKEPAKKNVYSIDIYWKRLQKDHWYITIPLSVCQYSDYSDIEKRVTDYSRAMLDLEKKGFFQKPENIENIKMNYL